MLSRFLLPGLLGFMTSLFVLMAPLSFAIPPGQVPGCTGTNCFSPPPADLVEEPLREADIRTQVITIVNYLLSFLGLICVLMVIYAGFLMIFSGGSDEPVGRAKNVIIWVAVGIVVILLSYAIVNFLFSAAN